MGVVIVIDPGHGGSNEGGIFGNYMEKVLTLKVAKALKEHLEKFDGVTVYLTRDSDVDMEISERLAFANSVNADFFVSLHFNMSAEHDLYGFEVWLPSHKELYNKAYPFAEIIHQDYTAGTYSLFSRGIKTRLGNQGDYYGVIRYGTQYNIPSVIVEHAHLDNSNDNKILPYNNLDNALHNMGVRDAEALAKAFHLSSQTLGEDYTNYALPKANVTSSIIAPDETAPDVCNISLLETDVANGRIKLRINAEDKGSYITYYRVSTDGGATWSALYPYLRTSWNKSEPTYDVDVPVPYGKELNVSVLAYNARDIFTESNHISVPALTKTSIKKAPEDEQGETFMDTVARNEEIMKPGEEILLPDDLTEIDYAALSAGAADTSSAVLLDGNGFYISGFITIAVLFLVLIIAMYKFIFKRAKKVKNTATKNSYRTTYNNDGFDIDDDDFDGKW